MSCVACTVELGNLHSLFPVVISRGKNITVMTTIFDLIRNIMQIMSKETVR